MDFKKLGVTEEEIKEYENIVPSFDFKELKYDESIVFEFVNDEIKELEQKAKHENKEKSIKVGDKIITPTILVKPILKLSSNGDEYKFGEKETYTLWLSAKTLALGVSKICKSVDSVKGLQFKVTKTKTNFKSSLSSNFL